MFMTTFEDIFNKLTTNYQGKNVEINTKQDGITIANFTTTIKRIEIKPTNKQKKSQKLGVIIIKGRNKDSFNIPFKLGFDTMKAYFFKNGVTIKTMDFEFIIKKKKKSA